jgi:hypothetical protein
LTVAIGQGKGHGGAGAQQADDQRGVNKELKAHGSFSLSFETEWIVKGAKSFK